MKVPIIGKLTCAICRTRNKMNHFAAGWDRETEKTYDFCVYCIMENVTLPEKL